MDEDEKVIDMLQRRNDELNPDDWFGITPPEDLSSYAPVQTENERTQRVNKLLAEAADERILSDLEWKKLSRSTDRFKVAIQTSADDPRAVIPNDSQFSLHVQTKRKPRDIDKALQEQVPQALLRDLHRSEKEFTLQLEWHEIEGTQGAWDLSVSEEMQTNYSVAMVKSNPMSGTEELKQILDEPWENSRPDNPRPIGVPSYLRRG